MKYVTALLNHQTRKEIAVNKSKRYLFIYKEVDYCSFADEMITILPFREIIII